MIISQCPKCGSLKCAIRVYKFEAHPTANEYLEGEWPCQWSPEKTAKLEYLVKQPWRMPGMTPEALKAIEDAFDSYRLSPPISSPGGTDGPNGADTP